MTTKLKPHSLNYYYYYSDIADKECPYQTGVALGGSSVVNNFIYSRGNRHDFDRWQAMGNDGWAYNDLLPYFKKIERRTGRRRHREDNDEEDIADGPLNIEQPRYTTGLLPVYLKAGQQLGLKVIDGGQSQVGIGIVQGTSVKGKRLSAAGAYIRPVYQDRPNLHVLTNARATRILIDDETKSAHAVQYRNDGVRTVVKAQKEIILSGGPIGSAHLLMLSGVGPKKMLEKVNVTVIKDLPVGQSFLANIAVQAPHFLINTTGQSIHIKRIGLNSFLQFNSGRGVLTSYTGTEAISYLKTPFSDKMPDQPDVELQFVSGGVQSDMGMGFRKVAQIKEDVYEALFKPIESPHLDSWSTIVSNLHSNVRGKLKLVDNDLNTDPIINYPFFEDTQDLDSLVFGIQHAEKFAKTEAFQAIGTRIYETPLPSCGHFKIETTEYWQCYIRHLTTITPQLVGTNRMGPSTDPEAVVDSELRVRGISNLRVADTSIIPTTISGHLQAISYVIGEKLANMLRKDWKVVSDENTLVEDEGEDDLEHEKEEEED